MSASFTLHVGTLPSTSLPLTSLVKVERDGDAHVGEAMWCKVISCDMICLLSEKESQDRPRLLECTPRTLHVYQLHTHTQSSLQLFVINKTLPTTDPALTGEAWWWRLCSLISADFYHRVLQDVRCCMSWRGTALKIMHSTSRSTGVDDLEHTSLQSHAKWGKTPFYKLCPNEDSANTSLLLVVMGWAYVYSYLAGQFIHIWGIERVYSDRINMNRIKV